jgi:hypothetical protein
LLFTSLNKVVKISICFAISKNHFKTGTYKIKNAAAATGLLSFFFKWGYHEIENLKMDTKLAIFQ